MNLYELSKLSKMHNFSEIQHDKLITDFGLYDSLLIEISNVRFHDECRRDDEVPYVSPSQDVENLHDFAFSKKPIMLPCPYCGRLQAFKSDGGYRNPLKMYLGEKVSVNIKDKFRYVPLFKPGTVAHVVDGNEAEKEKLYDEKMFFAEFIKKVQYSFVENKIYTGSYNVLDNIIDYERIKDGIAHKTMIEILENVSDLRKDYVCSYDENHHLFIEFILCPAVDEIPEELKQVEKKLIEENSNSEMSDEEKECLKLYNNLRTCLIVKKVAQYPSMADMQFPDRVKYKPVLKKQYTDYAMALGLYADGVGAGAFVYLRRIMESIVEEFHEQCIELNGWSEEEYIKKRFNEKIDYLEDYGKVVIPEELTEVKKELYGILSKGIHTASDDECRQLFPYMKFAIDTFLNKKVEENERQKRIEELNREVRNITDS